MGIIIIQECSGSENSPADEKHTMGIFLSWSGTQSKRVGEALKDWLPNVVQAFKPWMSSRDISAGETWHAQLNEQLRKMDMGILCITPSTHSDWMLFEAGALCKAVEGQVIPYIFGGAFSPQLPKHPFGSFQAVNADEHGTMELVRSLNDHLKPKIDKDQLKKSLGMWWPSLEK